MGNLPYRVVQHRRCGRWDRGGMDDTSECLPLMRSQGDHARGSGMLTCRIGEPHHALRNYAVGRHRPLTRAASARVCYERLGSARVSV